MYCCPNCNGPTKLVGLETYFRVENPSRDNVYGAPPNIEHCERVVTECGVCGVYTHDRWPGSEDYQRGENLNPHNRMGL